MAQKVFVSSQTMSKSSIHGKLTLPQNVLKKVGDLFPQELDTAKKADLMMFPESHINEDPFAVTAALHKRGKNGERMVLLQKGWKPVAEKLELEEGDEVSIFLLDKNAWTYSIEVEKAPKADPEPDQPRIKLDLNQPASPT